MLNRKLLTITGAAALVFALMWTLFVEVSALPLGVLLCAVMVYARYAVDRFMFADIDTIQYLHNNPAAYVQYMQQYTWIIIAAFALALATVQVWHA